MKKRLFGLALALCMALALLPTAAFAEGSGEIELTENSLETYKETDQFGSRYLLPTGNYKLAENIEVTDSIWIANAANVTVDLNGHTHPTPTAG